VVAQHVAIARCVTHPELHGSIGRKTSSSDKFPSDTTLIGRHLGLEELRCCLIGGEDLHPQAWLKARTTIVDDA